MKYFSRVQVIEIMRYICMRKTNEMLIKFMSNTECSFDGNDTHSHTEPNQFKATEYYNIQNKY